MRNGKHVDEEGTITYYLNYELHRVDGPACEYADGSKIWRLNGKLHREDGPAIENSNGTKWWYLNGVEYTEEEFKAHTLNSKMKTSFKDFLEEVEAEAKAEGPKAVKQLQALHKWFSKVRRKIQELKHTKGANNASKES